MARTTNEIYNEIVAEKQNQSSLSMLAPINDSATQLLIDVSSTSKVAFWRLWAWLMAYAIHVHEGYYDAFLVEADAIAQRAEVGTPRWYQHQILSFQYGDALVFLNQKYQYATIDESKKIVKRCAIIERANGTVLAKVAKLNSSGIVEPLNQTELNSLIGYVAKVKFAGTRLGCISQSADQITMNYNVLFDAQYPESIIKDAVKLAIESYIANLPFDGKLYITYVTDAIQKVSGVIDPRFVSASGTPQGQSVVSFVHEYESTAGHITMSNNFINQFTFTPIFQS
jgi:hypothetical protein